MSDQCGFLNSSEEIVVLIVNMSWYYTESDQALAGKNKDLVMMLEINCSLQLTNPMLLHEGNEVRFVE